MSDQDITCTYCGAVIPTGHSMCPQCNRLVASRPVVVEAMPADQLPPGMTDEAPPAIYGHVGERGYVPPTAPQPIRHEPKRRPIWVVPLRAALAAIVVIGALVALVYLLTS